jgi:UDPglucose 6-dehydrogenase
VAPETICGDLRRATGLSDGELQKRVVCEADAYRAVTGAHAVVVLTEWDQFKSLDFECVYRRMKKPAFAFDGRNVLPHEAMRSIGFEVYGIGKPTS